MQDPFPQKLLLSRKELAEVLSMGSDTLGRFLAEEKSFPRPILAGKVEKRPATRERWYKEEVYEWLLQRKGNRIEPS